MTDFRVEIVEDSVAAMRDLDEFSIDAVVADPPYGIGFAGHEWDQPGFAGRRNGAPGIDEYASDAIEAGRYDHTLHGNRIFQRWSEEWAREALRVLKPGGFLVSFSSTRTYHRMAAGIEDAGFEIRDTLLWLHGSGFPKAKRLGKGRATALKPCHEPIALARKPLDVRGVADNVEKWGTGALNIEDCRVPFAAGDVHESELRRGRKPRRREGSIRSSDERYAEVRAGETRGRWPANILLTHDEDCVLRGTRRVKGDGHFPAERKPSMFQARGHDGLEERNMDEIVPVYECAPGCPVAALDAQSGDLHAGGDIIPGNVTARPFQGGVFEGGPGERVAWTAYGDRGGASRFYYCAKTSRSEREAGLLGLFPCRKCGELHSTSHLETIRGKEELVPCRRNIHPTVKPIDLMAWLVRLVTPLGGTVLDPFCGSGTTGCAAALESRPFVGYDRDERYVGVARARIGHWRPDQLSLLSEAG